MEEAINFSHIFYCAAAELGTQMRFGLADVTSRSHTPGTKVQTIDENDSEASQYQPLNRPAEPIHWFSKTVKATKSIVIENLPFRSVPD
jgi:hypothetical protein